MSRRLLLVLCLMMCVASIAIPVLTGTSPWRLRGGRSRLAEDAVADLAAARTAERDRAEQTLIDLGSAALPVLADLPSELPIEVRLRAHRAETAIRSGRGDLRKSDFDQLQDDLVNQRIPADTLLRRLGARALPSLWRAMNRHGEDVEFLHLTVAHAIRCGGPEATDILSRIVSGDDVPASAIHRATEALARSSSRKHLEHARLLLEDPTSARRASGVRVLLAHGALDDPEDIDRAIRDPSPYVRRECVTLLADPDRRDHALPLLTDPDMRVRLGAVAALRGVRDPDAVKVVRERLADPSCRVRAAAVTTLAASGFTRELASLADDASIGVRLAVRKAINLP